MIVERIDLTVILPGILCNDQIGNTKAVDTVFKTCIQAFNKLPPVNKQVQLPNSTK